MVSGEGCKTLMSMVIECLPTSTSTMSPEASLNRLSALANGPLYEFVNKAAQAEANFVKSAVQSLHLCRRPPSLDVAASATLKSAYAQLGYFCTTEVDDGPGTKIISGRAAADVIFKALDEKSKGADPLRMDDLVIGRFFFLLNSAQNEKLKAWCATLLPSWDGDMKTGDGSAVDPKAKKARFAESQVDKEVDDAFA